MSATGALNKDELYIYLEQGANGIFFNKWG